MINAFREYYTSYLKEQKGKIIKMDDLEIDLTFATMDNWRTILTHGLVVTKAVKLHFGIQVHPSATQIVKDEVVQVKLFNELKANGPELNLNSEKYKDIQTREDLQKAAKERVDEFKEEVKEAQQMADIRILRDEIILLPFDVEPSSYQLVIDTINKHDKMVYNEDLYIEIL